MTNGDFFNALEIMGYESLDDCPLSEEQVENIAKTIATIEQERDEAERLRLYNFDQITKLGKDNSDWQRGYRALEVKVGELEAQRDASTPHRNRDYSTNPISDDRLAQMCDETRWWKTDGDEIYRVVHELNDMRPEVRELRSALAGLYARHNDGSEEHLWAEWDTAQDLLKKPSV